MFSIHILKYPNTNGSKSSCKMCAMKKKKTADFKNIYTKMNISFNFVFRRTYFRIFCIRTCLFYMFYQRICPARKQAAMSFILSLPTSFPPVQHDALYLNKPGAKFCCRGHPRQIPAGTFTFGSIGMYADLHGSSA